MVTLHCSFRSIPRRAPLALVLLLACDPSAKSVGDELLTASASSEPEWSYLGGDDTYALRITAMPDGGVAAIEHRQESFEQRITRYAPDGSELWQVDVGSSRLHAIAALPDGRLIVGGSVDQGSGVAAMWRLSAAGAIEATRLHPILGPIEDTFGEVDDLAVSSTGIAYLVSYSGSNDVGAPASELWWVDLDLDPQWSWTGFEATAKKVTIMPSGEIRTIEPHLVQDEHERLRGFGADGTPTWDDVVPAGTRFAEGDPLLHVEPSGDDLRIHAVGNTGTFDVLLTSNPMLAGAVVTHGHGVAAVSSFAQGSELWVRQFDDDGTLVRELTRPPLAYQAVAPFDVAIAPDGSLYVSGMEVPQGEVEDEPQGPVHAFILKLPPPA